MRNDDDRSYKRYREYRYNRYRYEREQIVFPVFVIAVLTIISLLWKYILIAIALICFVAVILFLIYLYLEKQLTSKKPIVLTKEDVKEGANVSASITYKSETVHVDTVIPPGVKDGQKFVLKNVIFTNKNGRKIKKNVHFKIQIL